MKQVHVYISGFVQGVGFRQYVLVHAGRLNLCGWVRNTSDNRVEAVFRGEDRPIEAMLDYCKKGPFLAEVRTVDAQAQVPQETLQGFMIRETA
jgi:acylphosphatase